MDSPTLNHVSLCAGYGGIDLGLRRAIPSLRTVAFAEIEGFACANLVAKMEAGLLDAAPIWTDLKTFPYAKFRGLVDILSGGYPCQPFSAAGQRRGKDDPRHLWPWIADGIAAMRPAVCFFENVEGHISLGLSDVIEDLAGLGYRTTWGIFSAAQVGAPHQRKRVFILAYRIGERLEGFVGHDDASDESRRYTAKSNRSTGSRSLCVWPSRPSQLQHEWEPPRVVGNTEGRKDDGREPGGLGCAEGEGGRGYNAIDCSGEGVGNTECSRLDGPTGKGVSGQGREKQVSPSRYAKSKQLQQIEPALGRDAHGHSLGLDYAELCVTCDNRTDELRLLGNGVVPATAELAFKTLMAQLNAADS
jgi:DNA (cytosine-5)-methyltransferase 1